MTTLAGILALTGNALLFAAVSVKLFRRLGLLAPAWRGLIVVVLIALAFVPINGLPLAAYLRAAFADLSIISLCLLTVFLMSFITGKSLVKAQEIDAFTALILASAVFLYPMALGIGYFDPYALGYDSISFGMGVFIVALGAWLNRYHLAVLCLVLAVVGHANGLLDSSNLWDYLLDPVLVFYALLRQIRSLRRRFARNPKSDPVPG